MGNIFLEMLVSWSLKNMLKFSLTRFTENSEFSKFSKNPKIAMQLMFAMSANFRPVMWGQDEEAGCGLAFGSFVSQPESTVQVQPGLPTSLGCHVYQIGRFSISWIKMTPNEAPVCVATAKSLVDDVSMCEQFENHSRIKVTWNQTIFTLSFSSVEQTDVGTYFCGMYSYKHVFFGNGSKLILEEHTDDVSPNKAVNSDKKKEEKDAKIQLFEYLVPVLAVTNVASILLVILLLHLSKKKRSGKDKCLETFM
ncbi:hypothetical protein NFI96_033226 [Prochilodus magdalenae]|nr:hypothetical protein NFI96_033226 [Prochilodus magdalenae]